MGIWGRDLGRVWTHHKGPWAGGSSRAVLEVGDGCGRPGHSGVTQKRGWRQLCPRHMAGDLPGLRSGISGNFPLCRQEQLEGHQGSHHMTSSKLRALLCVRRTTGRGRAPEPAAVFWMGLETALLSSSTLCQHIPEIAHPSKETVRSPEACKNTLEFKAGCYGQPDQW